MLSFDIKKKDIHFNGIGTPTDEELEGESVRLYLELSSPTKTITDDDGSRTVANPNYIGDDPTTMPIAALELVKPKSEAQREFLQRVIDIRKNRRTEKDVQYIGESGFSKRKRIYQKDTIFTETPEVSRSIR